MTSPHRPFPLSSSDTAWMPPGINDDSSSHPRTSSSLDLVPAPRASDLQIILRTSDHAAYYDPSSNQLSLQRRTPARSLDASASEPSTADAPLAPLVPHRNKFREPQSLLQRFSRATPLSRAQPQAVCPACARPWPLPNADPLDTGFDQRFQAESSDRESPSFIAPNYFRLLAQATTCSSNGSSSFNIRSETPSLPRNRFESASGSSTPLPSGASTPPEPINHSSEAQGYYSRFFVELKQLGRGARGQVYLCQHVLNGNKLGKYAIKKIPVGDHAQSLLQSLNEVHLMESLHHPHLIHYQHAWIERCQLSAFGPEVPTLFVLMMAANGGSLADWISARAGDAAAAAAAAPEQGGLDSPRGSGLGRSMPIAKGVASGRACKEQSGTNPDDDGSPNPAERRRIERLKAALRQRRANRSAVPHTPPQRAASHVDMEVGVHLLRNEEIYSLLTDITSGLAFLHDRGILHLDIKPGNVLLHWDEDSLIPRAMLSDFGSSLLLHDNWTRTRSGHTGTMEYMSPETILVDPVTGRLNELSSKADIWSLGMILHLLLFFRLPFSQTQDVDVLRREMEAYGGFKTGTVAEKGRGDDVLLALLERMLQVDPVKRPSCKQVLQVLAARQAETGARDDSKKSYRSKWHDDEQGRVSLALYRPSALPPLPDHRARTPDAAVLNTSLVAAALDRVPPQTAAIAIALLKCLSPALIHSSSSSGPRRSEGFLPTLMILLALIDLKAGRTSVSVACSIGHFVLCIYLVGVGSVF